jgi:uncharacterized protein YndB with AHSA1/START domain
VARFQVQREIEAPPERVWEIVTDVEAWPTWTASISSIERLDDAPFGIGSRVRIRQPKLPPAIWRVTDFDPGRYFAWSTSGGGIRVIAVHRVEPAGESRTRLTLETRQSGLLAPIYELLFRKLGLSYMNLEADGLKRRCEAP